jgi:hypothetical protein
MVERFTPRWLLLAEPKDNSDMSGIVTKQSFHVQCFCWDPEDPSDTQDTLLT